MSSQQERRAMDRLFDPPGPRVTADEASRERAADRKRERVDPAEPVPVAIGPTWRLMERHKKPEVHAYKTKWLIKVGPNSWMDGGSIQAVCGAIGIPLTVDPGTLGPACRDCLAAGAQP